MFVHFLVLVINAAPEFSMGVTGWAYSPDTVRNLAKPLGIQWTFVDANWDFIGRFRGQEDFHVLGRELERAKRSGYKVILGVKGIPSWASSVPVDSSEISRDSIWDVWDSLTYKVLLRKLKFQNWPPADTIWGKFVEKVVRFAENYFNGQDLLINVWNEPDGTRIGVVCDFYRMFVDTSEFLIGQAPAGDSVLFLMKLGDSYMEHPEDVVLIKRYYQFGGEFHDIDVCTLTVDHRFLAFVRDTLWTPEYYAREIYYPAYLAAKRVDRKVGVVPASPMYATFVNFKDRLPPDNEWRDLHWDAGSIAQLVNWVERFWNTRVNGEYTRECADGFTHHFYVPNRGHLVSLEGILPAVLDSLRRIYGELGILGKKPLYVTEFGFATWPHRHPEADPVYDSQAVYYSDFLRIFYKYKDKLNIKLVEAYRWCDNPLVKPRGDFFGMIFLGDTLSYGYYKKNPVPKPCYYVFKEFSQVCAGRSYLAPDSASTSGANGKKISKLAENIVFVFPCDQGLLCLLDGRADTLKIKNEPFLRNPAIASDDHGYLYAAFCGDSGLYIAERESEGRWNVPGLLFRPGSFERISFPSIVIGKDGILHISFIIESMKASNKLAYGSLSPTERGFRLVNGLERVASVRERCEPFLGLVGNRPVLLWKEKDRIFAYMKGENRWAKLWEMPAENDVEGFAASFDLSERIQVAWSDRRGLYYRVYSVEEMKFGKVEKVASMGDITELYLFGCDGRPCIIFSMKEKSSNPFLKEKGNLYLALRGSRGNWTFFKLEDGDLDSRYPQGIWSGDQLQYLWTETGYRFHSVKVNSIKVDMR